MKADRGCAHNDRIEWIGKAPITTAAAWITEGNLLIIRGAIDTALASLVLRDALAAGRQELGRDAYFERLTDSVRLCRIERLVDHVPSGPELEATASQCVRRLGFTGLKPLKDKLNVKWPGGGGYRCHQDARAYGRFAHLLAFGSALTDCNMAEGCLWVATGVPRLLNTDDQGCVSKEITKTLEFEPIELRRGDAVLFSGTVPHYSETNVGKNKRAMAFLTYVMNHVGDGDPRAEYYRWRSSRLSSSENLSTISDFAGKIESAR